MGGENMEYRLSEAELVEYVKPYLKAKGFKKKNKRWTKETEDFTISFLIQGSCYDKEDYYIRPGIFINSLMPTDLYYGHWMTEIKPTTPQEIMIEFEKWCEDWTTKTLIKERLLSFIEWEERNPLEKRRQKLVDYDADPVPANEFFAVTIKTKEYILEKF